MIYFISCPDMWQVKCMAEEGGRHYRGSYGAGCTTKNGRVICPYG